ncbi:Nucleoporin nup84 [Arachnomyces sp. PD_36]|nr:Nucleoporin nup84 [Arachnomyces sp. PD_36]
MAPLTRAPGSLLNDAGLNSTNFSQRDDPEVIEIDDDDDEEEIDEGEEGDEDEDESEDVYEDDEDGSYEDEGEEDESGAEVIEIDGSESGSAKLSPDAEQGDQDVQMSSGELLNPADLMDSTDLQQVLHPLRHAADRVGRQIATFAQTLDKFKQTEKSSKRDTAAFKDTCTLIRKYEAIANDSRAQLSRQNTLRRAKQSSWGGSKGFGAQSQSEVTGAISIDEQITRLDLEAQTWTLLHNLVNVNDPDTHAKSAEKRRTALQSLHRYSTDREIWEKFLTVDQFSVECVNVLKWLEIHCSTNDLESLITELETQAERGQGLWAHGWLYTKEAIKGQKRLRSWPQPLEPNDPGITLSLLSSEKSEPLITQLDPDALTRQNHGLQKQDKYYEQATWLACWKMLRKGESWTKIREWSEQHLESWRAVSLCGASVDDSTANGQTPADDSLTRMMSYHNQESWRSACSVLANNPGTDDFERAVYALLCGETEPAYKVCRSWDDYLYVFYNNLLISRYHEFCKQFRRKLSHSPDQIPTLVVEPPAYGSIRKFLDAAKDNDRIGVEARNPYRTIQAAILSRSYDWFFYHQANAVSAEAVSTNKSSLIPNIVSTNVDNSLLISARDEDSLRIIAHIFLLVQDLGYLRSDSNFIETASVNILGFIELLQQKGGLEMIPLYASMLPESMAHDVLGKVLIDVVEPEERAQQVALMQAYNIDAAAVLDSQWKWVRSQCIAQDEKAAPIRAPKSVENGSGADVRIGLIKKKFMGRHISMEDEQALRSLDWHRYIEGQWEKICSLGTGLYLRFLSAGKLQAARELSMRTRLADVSAETIGFDIADLPAMGEDGDEVEFEVSATPVKGRYERRPNSKSLETKELHETMYQQSQTMRELEQLILAFDALEGWADCLDDLQKNTNPRDAKGFKDKLEECLNYVTERVDPICSDWLTSARDGKSPKPFVPREKANHIQASEENKFRYIRTTYLPEVILAYHSALYTSGHIISRDILAECLSLATVVSGSKNLTDSFVASQRMCELVDVLALSSREVASIEEPKSKKKLPHGASLGIWKVDVPDTKRTVPT